MLKKILCLFIALLVTLGGISSFAEDAGEKYPIGYWSIAYPHRYVIFASDGGSYIRPLRLKADTTVEITKYIPQKEGYIFDGWYSDPRTKENEVTKIKLDANYVVYAKWIDDGSIKLMSEPELSKASNEEIMQYGNHIDEETGVPVTALWKERDKRLKELMEQYNQNFNN